jgi:hypothetical protein
MTITEIDISHVMTLGDNRFYLNKVMNELSMNVWSYELFIDECRFAARPLTGELNIDVSLCDYINCLEWYRREAAFNNYEFNYYEFNYYELTPMFAEPDDITEPRFAGVLCAPAA